MLSFISLGISDEKDMSLKALERAQSCDILYWETYTDFLITSKDKLEKVIGKEIITLDRTDIEEQGNRLLNEAKDKKIGLLFGGSCFAATTHISLFIEAKKNGIIVDVIDGSSIFSAIGIVGLELYKYGKVTSIPVNNKNVVAPIKVYEGNTSLGLHTLFLLDLKPKENKFLTISDASEYLSASIPKTTLAIGCARLGGNYKIVACTLAELKTVEFGSPPYCLIIPGSLHFIEDEALQMWKQCRGM